MSTPQSKELQVVPQAQAIVPEQAVVVVQPGPKDLFKSMKPEAIAEAKIRGFALVLDDPRALAEIGSASAQSLTATATLILDGVRVNTAGPVGEMLITLAASTQELNPQELTTQKGVSKLRGILVKAGLAKDVITQFLQRYDSISDRIDAIQHGLKQQQENLITDAQRMNELSIESEALSAQLLLDAAGINQRLTYEKRQLQGLNLLAERGQPFDEAKRDLLTTVIPILEQKQADLLVQAFAAKLTAEQAKVQMKSNIELAAKVGSALTLTMTVWKTQIAVFVTSLRNQEAAKGTAAVRDVTGSMLEQTASALHTGAVMAAKEANTPLIAAETLIRVVNEYKATVDDVIGEYQRGQVIRETAAKTIAEQVAQLEASKASAAAQISTNAAGNAPQITSPR